MSLGTHLPVSAIVQKALLRRVGATKRRYGRFIHYPYCIPLIRNAEARWAVALSRSKNITNLPKRSICDAVPVSTAGEAPQWYTSSEKREIDMVGGMENLGSQERRGDHAASLQ